MNAEIELIKKRLVELELQCARSDEVCQQLKARSARSDRRLRLACGLGLASLIVALFASPASQAVAQSGYGATLQSLINKTQYIRVADGQMYVEGTSLHVRNGLGATNGNPNDLNDSITNGLGNLIVGYNGPRPGFAGPDVRTGSHCIILGDWLNYAGYGSMVTGLKNTVAGNYAAALGGSSNSATSFGAVVTGGDGNTASGPSSLVAGGASNLASASESWAGGGALNRATNEAATVIGGRLVFEGNRIGFAAGGDYVFTPPGSGPGVFHSP
jgi:hypothetical protein